MKISLFYVIILTTFSISMAQDKPLDEKIIEGSKEEVLDTLTHKYNFTEGDTLEYSLVSDDSILVNWESALTKDRHEKIRLVCEKVDKKSGHFFISYEYTQYKGYENKPLYVETERDKQPWLNKKVIIEIDSIGNRYSYSYTDTTTKGFTAGGPFQGSILQPLGKKQSAKGQSWIRLKDTIHLAENGYETPLSVITNLFENKGEVDTLGRKCVRVDLSLTGSSQVLVNSKKAVFLMIVGQNGHAEVYLSEELGIPVFMFYTQEQRFDMRTGGDNSTKGLHYSFSTFKLDRFVAGKDRIKQKK
jgi:hypothetical protein